MVLIVSLSFLTSSASSSSTFKLARLHTVICLWHLRCVDLIDQPISAIVQLFLLFLLLCDSLSDSLLFLLLLIYFGTYIGNARSDLFKLILMIGSLIRQLILKLVYFLFGIVELSLLLDDIFVALIGLDVLFVDHSEDLIKFLTIR